MSPLQNPLVLRTGDMVLYRGPRFGPLASTIRASTAGVRHMFDATVAVHADLICSCHGQRLIVAMGPRGIEVYSPRARKRKRRPMVVRRHPVYDDRAVRQALAERLMYDVRQMYDYDYGGAVGFALGRVREDPKRYYCSEHVRYQTAQDGIKYPASFRDRVSPYQLQLCGRGWVDLDTESAVEVRAPC